MSFQGFPHDIAKPVKGIIVLCRHGLASNYW